MSSSSNTSNEPTGTDNVNMTNRESVATDIIATNDEWGQAGYPAGMLLEGSMLPTTPRDPRYWGPQDPMEFVGPPGPFDEEDGEELWRVHNNGRHVWTGEARVLSPRPSVQRQEGQTRFWQERSARRTHAQVIIREAEEVGEERSSDALQALSGTASGNPPSGRTTAQQSNSSASGVIQAAPSGSVGLLDYLHNNNLLHAQRPASHQPSSDIDGEYEIDDDDYLPDIPQAQVSTTNDQDNLPDSTPPKTSHPRGIHDWDDDNLLSFWKFKVIRKKGYEPMLAHFPNQTTESLHEVWKTKRERCEMLGAAWRAAGKPTAAVAAWLKE